MNIEKLKQTLQASALNIDGIRCVSATFGITLYTPHKISSFARDRLACLKYLVMKETGRYPQL